MNRRFATFLFLFCISFWLAHGMVPHHHHEEPAAAEQSKCCHGDDHEGAEPEKNTVPCQAFDHFTLFKQKAPPSTDPAASLWLIEFAQSCTNVLPIRFVAVRLSHHPSGFHPRFFMSCRPQRGPPVIS